MQLLFVAAAILFMIFLVNIFFLFMSVFYLFGHYYDNFNLIQRVYISEFVALPSIFKVPPPKKMSPNSILVLQGRCSGKYL